MEAFLNQVIAFVQVACEKRIELVHDQAAAIQYVREHPDIVMAKELYKHGITMDTPVADFIFDVHDDQRRSLLDDWNRYKLQLHSHPIVFEKLFHIHGNEPWNVDGQVATRMFRQVTLSNLITNQIWTTHPRPGLLLQPRNLQRLYRELRKVQPRNRAESDKLHRVIHFDAQTHRDPTLKYDVFDLILRVQSLRAVEADAVQAIQDVKTAYTARTQGKSAHAQHVAQIMSTRLTPARKLLEDANNTLQRVRKTSPDRWLQELKMYTASEPEAHLLQGMAEKRTAFLQKWEAYKDESCTAEQRANFIKAEHARAIQSRNEDAAIYPPPETPSLFPLYSWLYAQMQLALKSVVALFEQGEAGVDHDKMRVHLQEELARMDAALLTLANEYQTQQAAVVRQLILQSDNRLHLRLLRAMVSDPDPEHHYNALVDTAKSQADFQEDRDMLLAKLHDWQYATALDVTRISLYPNDNDDRSTAIQVLSDLTEIVDSLAVRDSLPQPLLPVQLKQPTGFVSWLVDNAAWHGFQPILPAPTPDTAQIHAAWSTLQTTSMPITFQVAMQAVEKLLGLFS
jgi:hypothetical protein